MSFNTEKCHKLTVTKKRNNPPQATPSTTKPMSDLGAELTENLHWGKHIQSTAANANKVSASTHRNPKRCLAAVQTNYHKGLLCPVPELRICGETPISDS